jgi:hypothetical protein
VKILGFGVFQGRLITDEGMSTTIPSTSGSERYVGKSKDCDPWGFFYMNKFAH